MKRGRERGCPDSAVLQVKEMVFRCEGMVIVMFKAEEYACNINLI